MTAALNHTLSPINIGSVQVPNRIVRTAHFTAFSFGAVTDELIAYHLERARAGVGLTILEAGAIHPSSLLGLTCFDDSVIEPYQKLMAALRPTGMRVFQQLFHGGHHYPPPGGAPTRGVSALPSPVDGFPAVPLSTTEVGEFVEAYVAAGRRVVAGGLDGIEIHSGHGYLPQQFLSPITNDRTDEYGGPLENRMRFLVEILQAVRGAVPGVPVGVRLSAGQDDETTRELRIVVGHLIDDGLVDFLDVSMGDYYSLGTQYAPGMMLGGMDREAGYQLPYSSRITRVSSAVPRIVTGRFRTLPEVEQAIESGDADLVSMVRAHIADPLLVSKTVAGQGDRVRPCIGCNQGCLARNFGVDIRMGCVVNPSVGFEETLSEDLVGTTAKPRSVLVVGGGPAGMEAARLARMRGHEVTVYEARAELGGALRIAGRAPNMSDLELFADWQARELAQLGVQTKMSTRVTVDDVVAARPDVVIIASGAEPDKSGRFIAAPYDPVPGVDLPHVLTPYELLDGRARELGPTAVVYDEMGQYEAVCVVEHLLAQGMSVTLATRLPSFGPHPEAGLRLGPALKRFFTGPGRFRAVTRARLVGVGSGQATIRPLEAPADGSYDESIEASTVVLVGRKHSHDGLAAALTGRVAQVQVIGDAFSARDLQTAIRQGHHAGRGIE